MKRFGLFHVGGVVGGYGGHGGLRKDEVPVIVDREYRLPNDHPLVKGMLDRTILATDKSASSWDDYLMGFAQHAATKSKDSTKVGAVLVGPEGEIRLTAYNGPPKGVEDRPERFERPAKYLFASHAEANLVAFAAREGIRTKGCAVYVTHYPCSSCARTLIQAGITRVVSGEGVTSMPDAEFEAAAVMFREARVRVEPMQCEVVDSQKEDTE